MSDDTLELPLSLDFATILKELSQTILYARKIMMFAEEDGSVGVEDKERFKTTQKQLVVLFQNEVNIQSLIYKEWLAQYVKNKFPDKKDATVLSLVSGRPVTPTDPKPL